MKRTAKVWLGWLTLCSIALQGCEQVDGACPGFQDGELFQLRVFNCTKDEELTVTVNGREVGWVEPMGDNNVCGVTDLGTFPQCSGGAIVATGTETTSVTLSWDTNGDAVRNNPTNCWAVMGVKNESTPSEFSLPDMATAPLPECIGLYLQETG